MTPTNDGLLLVITIDTTLVSMLHAAGVSLLYIADVDRARSALGRNPDIRAVYLDAARLGAREVWALVHAAQEMRCTVLVGRVAEDVAAELRDSQVPVAPSFDTAATVAWVLERLGMRVGVASPTTVIAVAGAKGGIGKTLVVGMLAEGLVQRGVRVLVVDGDLSNSGLVHDFRIPTGIGSFLLLRQEGRGHALFTPEQIARLIYHHPCGVDFLLGADETMLSADFALADWRALMRGVDGLREVLSDPYDVVLIDTGPDMKKRPYALDAARNGGWVVLPTPPSRKDRIGVGIALQQFALHQPDLTPRCLLVMMEPERGVTAKVADVAPLIQATWPQVRILGTLPRDPMLISLAHEEADAYLSPLTLAPSRPFARAVHRLVDGLVQAIELPTRAPMPTVPWWQTILPPIRRRGIEAARARARARGMPRAPHPEGGAL